MGRKGAEKLITIQPLVYLYLIFAALPFLTFPLAAGDIEFSLVCAALVALVMVLFLISGRMSLRKADSWALLFLIFIVLSTASLLASPYLARPYAKGIEQVLGLALIVFASLYLSRSIGVAPYNFFRYIKLLIVMVTLVAIIGLWQFAASNLLNLDSLADFSFINSIFPDEWKYPGNLGGFDRANSVAAEPAQFVRILGIVGGVSLLRLGLFGGALSNAIVPLMPRWAAIIIFIGFIISISIIGYTLLLLTALSIAIILYRIDFRSSLRILCAVLLVVGALWHTTVALESTFQEKLSTLSLIFKPITGEPIPISHTTGQLSALVIATNLSVTLDNLRSYPLLGIGPGAHPLSYELLEPGWVFTQRQSLSGVNSEDAASVFLRLLSETGILGTAFYLGGWLFIVAKATLSIKRALNVNYRTGTSPSPALGIAVGVTASCIAVPAMYLVRSGSYFDPPMWILLAITASVPLLLSTERRLPPRSARSKSLQRYARNRL